MEKLPEHGPCFVCGSANPQSIGVVWFVRDDDAAVVTEVSFATGQQGPPGHAHGGATTALLDEAMGAAVWRSGIRALAVNLNVQFHRPIPLGVPVSVAGWVTEKAGRKVNTSGEARLPDGGLAVSAEGVFVDARHLLDDAPRNAAWSHSDG